MLLYEWLKEATRDRGSAKALVYRDNYLSWRGLLHRVDRRAQEFKSMGIKEGAWVGLMLGNVPDFVILALALSKLDATIVPIDPTTGGRELALILAAAPLRALVTRRAAASTPCRRQPVASRPPQRHRARRPMPRDRAAACRARCSPARSTSKAARSRRRAARCCSPPTRSAIRRACCAPTRTSRRPPSTRATALEHDRRRRILTTVPLFHAYGWDLGLC